MALPYDAAALSCVLAQLRTGPKALTNPVLDYTNSGIQPEGKPPARTGRIYVAVDEGGISNDAAPEQDHLKERIQIIVTISVRSGRVASDRRGDIYLETLSSLGPTEREVKAALHGQVALIAAMNALLDPSEQGVQEGLWYTGRQKTSVESADWSMEEADVNKVTGWLVRRLFFIGFRRVQYKNSIA